MNWIKYAQISKINKIINILEKYVKQSGQAQ
jgi:hypothetical protein